MDNSNNKKPGGNINIDKFSVHSGEFVQVTEDYFKDKIVTQYSEFVEDDEDEEQ